MKFWNIRIGMNSETFGNFRIGIFRNFGIFQSIPIPIQFISELSDFGILESDYIRIRKNSETFGSESDGIGISYPSCSPRQDPPQNSTLDSEMDMRGSP